LSLYLGKEDEWLRELAGVVAEEEGEGPAEEDNMDAIRPLDRALGWFGGELGVGEPRGEEGEFSKRE
jgi:hypothetical protein